MKLKIGAKFIPKTLFFACRRKVIMGHDLFGTFCDNFVVNSKLQNNKSYMSHMLYTPQCYSTHFLNMSVRISRFGDKKNPYMMFEENIHLHG